MQAGEQVSNDLLLSDSFDWHRVSAEEAARGVRTGRYDFSLTLPEDFSSALASSGAYVPRQGVLGFATLRDQLGRAADGAGQLTDGSAKASSGAEQLATGADGLDAGQRRLLAGSNELVTGSGQLATGALATGAAAVDTHLSGAADQTRRAATAARQLADGLTAYRADLERTLRGSGLSDAQITALLNGLDGLRTPAGTLSTQLQAAGTQLGQLTTVSHQVAAGTGELNRQAPALNAAAIQAASGASSLDAGAHQLAGGAGDLRTGASRLATGEAEAVTGTSRLRTGLHQLSGSLVTLANGASGLGTSLRGGTERLPDLNDATRTATADTIADPVQIKNVAEATAHSYGAGLAPFFMSLAAWIGGFVLFLFLRPLSTRAMAANQSPLRVAVGGWLTPAWLGAAQMLLLFGFVVGVLRFDPAHPVATLAFMVLVSVTFIAIVHTLNAWLGTIGQFLGLVLMVLQLVSAGGTFPWQTLPAPLHVLHVLLPMGYAVDALRPLIYGGSLGAVHLDAWVLVGYLVAAVALTAVAARRMRIWTPGRIRPELVL